METDPPPSASAARGSTEKTVRGDVTATYLPTLSSLFRRRRLASGVLSGGGFFAEAVFVVHLLLLLCPYQQTESVCVCIDVRNQ